MTTYYVSSEIGNNDNAGTSESAPLATLQAAADLVKPGDIVEVMNGTYTSPGGGVDVLDITTSGTASAPITFQAAPGQTPVINSTGAWNAINIEASYIVVDGFTVEGDAANYTLATALAGYSSGNPNLDGNGIVVNPSSSVPLPNNITIENNTVYNEPGGGIGTEGADYVQILNNAVYGNAHWSAFGNSGISVSTSANLNTNSGVHDIISGNTVFGNAQLVPTTGGNTITDGEGIILDTNPGYTGEILVENNTVYSNGSSGIESFLTNNAVITGNTVYGNDTQKVQAASVAEIFINQSNNDTVTNNTTAANAVVALVDSYIKTEVQNEIVDSYIEIVDSYIKTEVQNEIVDSYIEIVGSYIKTEVQNEIVDSYIKTEVQNEIVDSYIEIVGSYIKTEVQNEIVDSYIKTEVQNEIVDSYIEIVDSYIKTEVQNEIVDSYIKTEVQNEIVDSYIEIVDSYIKTEVQNEIVDSYIKTEVQNEVRNAIVADLKSYIASNGFTVTNDPNVASAVDTAFCFMRGTLISTPRGEVAVDALKRGDIVMTTDGVAKAVTWIGRQTVSTRFADSLRVLPIRIRAGALGDNVPSRDLLLSPDHAILVGDVLIQAGALVNGTSIVRETDVPQIFTYYHVELDDHSLILAEDTPAETFVDNIGRLAFDNWEEHEALYPEGKPIVEMAYPRAKAHRQVPRAIREKLGQRAAARHGKDAAAA